MNPVLQMASQDAAKKLMIIAVGAGSELEEDLR